MAGTLAGLTNIGIPFAAACGALCFYVMKLDDTRQAGGKQDE